MFRTFLTVRTRLIAAFGIAALFTVLASAVAIVAFVDSRNAVDNITESHLQVVIAAHKVAERAQAVAAAAPTLMAAKAPSQLLTASTRINDQLEWLDDLIGKLRQSGIKAIPDLERKKSLLLDSFLALTNLVAERIEAGQELQRSMARLERIHRDLDLRVAAAGNSQVLTLPVRQKLQRTKELGSAIVNVLVAAAHMPRPEQMKNLEKEFRQLSVQLKALAESLPAKINATIEPINKTLTAFGDGSNSIFEIHRRELTARLAAERFLYAYNGNADVLVFAAEALIQTVRR